jgi:hypothetical protein
VFIFSQDKQWPNDLRTRPDAMALFRVAVEKRTRLQWDPENVAILYKRAMAASTMSAETRFRNSSAAGKNASPTRRRYSAENWVGSGGLRVFVDRLFTRAARLAVTPTCIMIHLFGLLQPVTG